jgi:hypothetical protein
MVQKMFKRLFEFKNFWDFQCRLWNTSSGMYLGSGKGPDQVANSNEWMKGLKSHEANQSTS